MISYGKKTQIDVNQNKVFYEGHEVEQEYGQEITRAFTRLNTARYLVESFEIADESVAFSVADKVRTLMEDHALAEAEAIFQVLEEVGYFANL